MGGDAADLLAHRVSGSHRSRLEPDPTMGKRKEVGSDKEVFADYLTANVLGANTGALLHGVGVNTHGRRPDLTMEALNSVSGVVLKVVQGVVLPYKGDRQLASETYNRNDAQGWAKLVSKETGLSPPQAQQVIEFFGADALEGRSALLGHTTSSANNGGPHHVPGGDMCRFVILSPGMWSHSNQVLAWQQHGTPVTAAEIGAELHRAQEADPAAKLPGMLALRASLWIEAQSSGQVEPQPGDAVFVNVSQTLCSSGTEAHYNVKLTVGTVYTDKGEKKEVPIDTTIRIVAPPPETELQLEEVSGLVLQEIKYMMSDACKFKVKYGDGPVTLNHIFESLTEEQAEAQVAICFKVLSGPNVSFGGLKSCIQKLARVQADKVRMPQGEIVNGRVAIMVCLGLLFTSRGSGFVPDLGLYVRGATSALKRLGVVMVEDAWPTRAHLKGLPGLTPADRDPGVVMAAILSTSLLTAQVADYYPRRSIIRNCMHVMAAALHSDKLISWRNVDMSGTVMGGHANELHMLNSARVLRTLRAFKGDMDMFDQVAGMVDASGRILTKANPHNPEGLIPLNHMIDQHVYRGFTHSILNFPRLRSQSFANRFNAAFDNVTGFSPRIANKLLDEQDVVVRAVRYAQGIVALNVFPGLLKERLDHDGNAFVLSTVVEQSPLDYGVMSGGVNALGGFQFKTTPEENEADGFFPGGKKASQSWNLQVILPVEKPGEIVIHFVTAHAKDPSKQPKITATAKRKAITLARAKMPIQFLSPMLPKYTQVYYQHQSDQYILKGPSVADFAWKFDSANSVDVQYSMFTLKEPYDLDIRKDANIVKWASHRLPASTPAMASYWKELITSIFNEVEMANARLLRMLTFIKQQYVKVTLPTPGIKGEQGSDQMRAAEGDWVVWRLLLAVSWVCPGALTPKQVPSFDVPDARLLRLVERHLNSLVVSNVCSPQQQLFLKQADDVESKWEDEGARNPFDYQTALVTSMLKRDKYAIVRTQGHFVSLDTGLGKSFVGLYYALRHAADIGGVDRIIWVTPVQVLATIEQEAADWGIEVFMVNRSSPSFRNGAINVVGFEWYSTGSARGGLEIATLAAAKNSFIAFDEVHNMYSSSIRNSTMREAALLSSKFIAMTATPIGNKKQAFAIDWLADSVGFPVSRTNELVAAAVMVAAKISLPIEGVESLSETVLDPEDQMKHTQLLKNGRRWAEASAICRVKTTPFLIRTAIEAAIADRVAFPTGGAMMVLDNKVELENALVLANQMIVQRGYTWSARERTLETSQDPSVGLIGVNKSDVTGYNLTRMGVMITGVYASSPASRHQLRGRIRRVGQARTRVDYITIVPKHTILDLLHQRHNSVDKANESLSELAQEIAARP
jgi:hypothetical protein